MLKCNEAAHQMSKSMDAPLTLKEKLSLALHLLLCPLCSEYKRQMLALRSMLAEELEKLLHQSDDGDEHLTDKEKQHLQQALTRAES